MPITRAQWINSRCQSACLRIDEVFNKHPWQLWAGATVESALRQAYNNGSNPKIEPVSVNKQPLYLVDNYQHPSEIYKATILKQQGIAEPDLNTGWWMSLDGATLRKARILHREESYPQDFAWYLILDLQTT